MKIAVARERTEGETRVAATPETVAKFIAMGAEVAVERGAGELARIPDAEYEKAGATVAATATAALKDADIVLTVRRPAAAGLNGVADGALVIGILDPYGNEDAIDALAKAGVTAVAMEFMPRITRAQVMDVLSSQANLAGYQAVLDAAVAFDRAFPMMMTAAGTIRPAKAFVMGAGVAGLQAIATARRLGAVVTATDVRAAAGEQVESLGAKFIMTDALKDASGSGGYARELTADERAAQQAELNGVIANQDIVITTAQVPGRKPPVLVTAEAVGGMRPGSVIVDMAASALGGNCELSKAATTIVTDNGVTIIAPDNLPATMPVGASQFYARNISALLLGMVKDGALTLDFEDEVTRSTVITHEGRVVSDAVRKLLEPAPAAGATGGAA
jgi:NAD(P) transhydrogenase subunit alpha